MFLDEIYLAKKKLFEDINKINETVSEMSGRDPDKNLDKSWGDWLSTTQVRLTMNEERKIKTK